VQRLFLIPNIGDCLLIYFIFEALSPRHLFPVVVSSSRVLFAGIFRYGSLP
jgi:hypothetical protein